VISLQQNFCFLYSIIVGLLPNVNMSTSQTSRTGLFHLNSFIYKHNCFNV